MTANKHTVQKFMDAISKSNHADVLFCLTDDVEWVIPGMSHTKGKDAFDKQIESEGLVSCTITVTRMTEEGVANFSGGAGGNWVNQGAAGITTP